MECLAMNSTDYTAYFSSCDFQDVDQVMEFDFANSNERWFQIIVDNKCLLVDTCSGVGNIPYFGDCPGKDDGDYSHSLWSDEGHYLWSYYCFVVDDNSDAILTGESCDYPAITSFSESSSEDETFVFIEDLN